MARPWEMEWGTGAQEPWQMAWDKGAGGERVPPEGRRTDGKRSGWLANIAAGANDALAGTAGLPVDAATGILNLVPRGINAMAGTQIPTIKNPIGGSDSIRGLFGMMGADPRNVAPANRTEELLRAGASGAAGAFGVGGMARALPQAGGAVMGAIQKAMAGGAAPSQGLLGGVAGMAGNEAEQHVSEPYKPLANVGAQFAAGAGAAAAGAGARGASNAFMGVGNISPERAALARRAIDDYGIPLTAPDIQPGRPPMKWMQAGLDYLPFSGAASRQDKLQRSVNQGVARTFGGDEAGAVGDRLGHGEIQGARSRIGADYDRALTGANVPIGDTVLTDLASIETRITQSALATNEQAALHRATYRILDAAAENGGVIPGRVYQEFRQRGSALDDLMSPGSPTRRYATDIKKALDRGFVDANPDRAAIYGKANEQWRAVEAIRPEVKRGEPGNISPLRIQGAANRAYPDRDVSGRGSALGDLGDIAQTFLHRLPESGTAPRTAVMQALGSLAGGAAGTASGVGLMSMMQGAGALLGGGRLGNSALNSQWLRDAMLNRVLNPKPGMSAGNAIPPWLLLNAPAQAGLLGDFNAQR